MACKRILVGLVPLVLLATAPAPASADRLLIDGPELTVTLARKFECGEPVDITVESKQPLMFKRQSQELQRVLDSVRAMLSFECPRIPEIHIHGRLKGLPDPLYRGVASGRTDWSVQTHRAIRTQEVAKHDSFGATAEEQTRAPHGDQPPDRRLTVVNLSTGMPVEDARTAIAETFGVEPEYDVGQGVLTMHADGCPPDYDWEQVSPPPKSGWKCLRAWFTDQRVAKLYRLELVQVVNSDESEAVAEALMDRFGQPVQRRTEKRGRRGSWDREQEVRYLIWGEIVEPGDKNQRPTHGLQAVIETMGDVVVTTLTLYEPSLQSGWVEQAAERKPDLKL